MNKASGIWEFPRQVLLLSQQKRGCDCGRDRTAFLDELGSKERSLQGRLPAQVGLHSFPGQTAIKLLCVHCGVLLGKTALNKAWAALATAQSRHGTSGAGGPSTGHTRVPAQVLS